MNSSHCCHHRQSQGTVPVCPTRSYSRASNVATVQILVPVQGCRVRPGTKSWILGLEAGKFYAPQKRKRKKQNKCTHMLFSFSDSFKITACKCGAEEIFEASESHYHFKLDAKMHLVPDDSSFNKMVVFGILEISVCDRWTTPCRQKHRWKQLGPLCLRLEQCVWESLMQNGDVTDFLDFSKGRWSWVF